MRSPRPDEPPPVNRRGSASPRPQPGRSPPLGESARAQLSGPQVDRLLTAAGHGDLAAFTAFYDLTAPSVYGLMSAVLGAGSPAEQTTALVYRRLWRHAAHFDPAHQSACTRLLTEFRRELVAPLHDRLAAR